MQACTSLQPRGLSSNENWPKIRKVVDIIESLGAPHGADEFESSHSQKRFSSEFCNEKQDGIQLRPESVCPQSAPVLSHDWSQKRPGLRSASSMSFPVVTLVPTTSAGLGVGDSSEPPMLKAKSPFIPLMQLARA